MAEGRDPEIIVLSLFWHCRPSPISLPHILFLKIFFKNFLGRLDLESAQDIPGFSTNILTSWERPQLHTNQIVSYPLLNSAT